MLSFKILNKIRGAIMRIVRIVVFALFAISVALFGYYEVDKLVKTDDTMPVITGPKEVLEVSCNYTEKELLSGLKASDEKDGDLTSEIVVGNISHFVKKGISKVTYVVFDSSNHPAKFQREVKFTDYHSPRFALTKPLVFKIGSTENIYELVGAKDIFDGDISTGVVTSLDNVNLSEEGTYKVKVSVTNSLGDTSELVLPVHVVAAPQLGLTIELKENIVYLKKGDKFNPESVIDNVYQSNGAKVGTDGIKISSNLNTNKSGVYEVKYSIDKNSGGKALTYLTVVVE